MTATIDAFNAAKATNPNLQLGDFVKNYAKTGSYNMSPTTTQAPSNLITPAPQTPSTISKDRMAEQKWAEGQGYSNAQVTQMSQNPAYLKLMYEGVYGDKASQIQGYPKQAQELQQAGEALNTFNPVKKLSYLENALKMVKNPAQQELGTSKLFAAAGLDDYDVLMQSLNQQGKSMKDFYGSYLNAFQQGAGVINSEQKQLTDTYARKLKDYDSKSSELSAIVKDITDHQQAMEINKQQSDLDMRKEVMKAKLFPKTLFQTKNGVVLSWDTDKETWEPVNVNGQSSSSSILPKLGNPSDKDYGECGYAANRLTVGQPGDSQWVGDDWNSKISKVKTFDNPEIGYKLVTRYGDKKVGHVGTVIGFDSQTRNVTVAEWNRSGDKQGEINTYNIDELSNQYSNSATGQVDWGFIPSQLKPEFNGLVQKINNVNNPFPKNQNQLPDSVRTLMEQYFSSTAPYSKDKILKNISNIDPAYSNMATNIASGIFDDLGDDQKYPEAVYTFLKSEKPSVRTIKAWNVAKTAIDGKTEDTKSSVANSYVTFLNTQKADELKAYNGGMDIMKDMTRLKEILKTISTRTGFFTGNAQEALQTVGSAGFKDLAPIRQELSKLIQSYTKGQTGSQFSWKEFKRYEQLFPSIKNGNDLNIANIDAMYSSIFNDMNTQIALNSGYSINNIMDIIPNSQWKTYGMRSEYQNIQDSSPTGLKSTEMEQAQTTITNQQAEDNKKKYGLTY